MPAAVGVFVSSGVLTAGPNHACRINRGFEYDGLGDNYARFLLDELLPHIAKTHKLNLSTDGNDRCIAGASSGGVCAFTAAWERPDAFRRVFSTVGSYAAFRGGNIYPILIRKVEPKPIRVFLQDGCNDLNIFGGDWWLANQEMERALSFSGYEVRHAWGTGGHDQAQATEVFPQAMCWLWKDSACARQGWPRLSISSRHHLAAREPWRVVARGYQDVTGAAANAKGEVFFNDPPAGKTYKIGPDGKVTVFLADSKGGRGQAFGPDGRLYAAAAGAGQIVAYDAQGRGQVIAEGIRGHGVAVGNSGNLYVTDPGDGDAERSRVWLININKAGKRTLVDTGLASATGVAVSRDQSFLSVADNRSHWVYSYQIRPDGSLTNRQQFEWLHVPDAADSSGADGLCTDQDGRRYVATRMGIQVSDGGVGYAICIIPTPNGRISDLCFGGAKFDTLFATCGDVVFQRKVRVRGARPSQPPVNGSSEKH